MCALQFFHNFNYVIEDQKVKGNVSFPFDKVAGSSDHIVTNHNIRTSVHWKRHVV